MANDAGILPCPYFFMERRTKTVREQIRELLGMHAAERRGVIMLLAALIALMGWAIYQQWFREPDMVDLAPMRAELEAWLAAKDGADVQADVATVEPFAFDPNTIDRDQWLALGLTPKQVDGIQRYMNKGGRFRTNKDLGRMYSIRPEQFERLKPFILLPDSAPSRGYSDRPRTYARDTTRRQWPERKPYEGRPMLSKVEVNTADTNSLVALPGIGPSFARGIVKYRESLGGYHSLDQLAEVYVLQDKPDAVIRLKELLVLDTLMVRRIAINACTVEELAAHPYARWKIAKPLIAYRTQHGPFKQLADIKGCALVTEEVFLKLAPYLSVE